jgi:hypothetical protein
MSNALTAGMKQILQRTVTAFLNSNYTDPDIAIAMFILPSADQ